MGVKLNVLCCVSECDGYTLDLLYLGWQRYNNDTLAMSYTFVGLGF